MAGTPGPAVVRSATGQLLAQGPAGPAGQAGATGLPGPQGPAGLQATLTTFTPSPGVNSNIPLGVTVPATALKLLSGATGPVTLGGFAVTGASPAPGTPLEVQNSTGQIISVANADPGSSAPWRILTDSGTKVTRVSPGGVFRFVYGNDSSWHLQHIGVVRQTVFDVRDFGAVGDGVTNDYTAIAAAVAACVAASGGTVWFAPTGASYLCQGQVQIGGNIRICGPHATDQSLSQGAVINFSGAGSGFVFGASVFDSAIEDLLLVTDAAGGPPISCANGAILSSIAFRRLKIVLGNPGVSGIALGSYAQPCQPEPVLLADMKISAAPGFYAPLIGMWGTSGGLSNITFEGKSVFTGNLLPQLGTQLAGTATLTNGSTHVAFSQNQTLLAGQLVQFSSDPTIVYEIAGAVAASGGATLTKPFSAPSASGGTAALVAEMIHIEAVDTNAVVNVDIAGIIFEVPWAGAIKFRGVRNSRIHNCWIGDMAPSEPIGHLIWIGKGSAGGSPAALNITLEHLNVDTGQQDAASVYTGNDLSTQSVSIKRSVIPWIQNVPTRDPGNYAANQGGFPIEFEGTILGGYSGDAPVGAYSNIYRRDWSRALPPDTIALSNGLNSSVIGQSGLVRSRYRVSGPTAPFSIDSLVPASIGSQSTDGLECEIYNPTTQYMTFIDTATASGGSALQRIQCCAGGSNVEVPGPGFGVLTYDNVSQRWVLGATSPGAAVFTPRNVTSMTLVAWWDAALRYTIATGVSSWVDQVQGRALVQASAAAQPAWSATSGPNNLPGITFSLAANQALQGAGFNYNQPLTVFIVCKWNSSTTTGTMLDGATTGNHGRFYRTAAGAVALFAGSQLTDSSATPQSFHVHMLTLNGASSSITTDGTLKIGPGAIGSNNPNGFTLGNYGDGASDPADAVISEVLVFAGTPSSADQSRVGRYLANKYKTISNW